MTFDQRRYQIFVSSTFNDLADRRKDTVEGIFEHGHIPIALENFAPANESDLEVIRSVMMDCQVYIMILGHRYGSLVKPDGDISYTELEYNIAEENNLLILPFVLRQDEIDRRREALNPNDIADRAEMENAGRLRAFHERIRRFRRLWGPDDQFKYLVLQSLVDRLPECTKPGLIQEASPDATAIMMAAVRNPVIVEIVGLLEGFKKLHERCSQQVQEKEAIATFLRGWFLDRVTQRKMSLFFESGSTVAYIAKEWGPGLAGQVLHDGEGPSIQISTNNVLAYLEFWLKYTIPCTAHPWGPPCEETFGASYGGSLEDINEQPADYMQDPLDVIARREIERLKGLTYGLTFRAPVLLFGAASGLQLNGEPQLTFPPDMDELTRAELQAQLTNCRGPHVGSYRNKVFKRFMYETRMPLVLSITGEKVNGPVEVNEAHFILDRDLSWADMVRSHPLAICVGCQQSDRERLLEQVCAEGFTIRHVTHSGSVSVFLAENDEFAKVCETYLNDGVSPTFS